MKTCPYCSSEIDDNAHFCSSCGHDFRTKSRELDDTGPLIKKNGKPGFLNYPLASLRTIPAGHLLLDRYEIVKMIGKGGMSVVYKAQDVVLDEIVAVKILKQTMVENQEMVQRFKREIKLGRKIKHPNVCHIYDFGFVDDIIFISMEYLEGIPLSKVIGDLDKLSLDTKLEIIRGILEAIAAAHKENIIHRDLKPSNIMLTPEYKPVIMDFGISRVAREIGITATGELLGTPTYMAPDQFTGSTPDQRSDIYALGVIYYELFTGVLPFSGSTPIEIAMKHLKVIPQKPTELNPDTPAVVEEIIMKCLEKEPDNRFQTIQEIMETFRHAKKQALPKEQTGRTRKKVMVADDDDNIRTLVGLALTKNGLDVIYASNGQEAISMCLENKPDAIITDLLMPKMDGLQMIEFLKDNPDLSDVPLMVMSAKSDKDYIAYCKSLGITEYFTKPFDINKFVLFVKSILSV